MRQYRYVADLVKRLKYHRLQLKQLVQYQMFSAWPGALCTVRDSKVPLLYHDCITSGLLALRTVHSDQAEHRRYGQGSDRFESRVCLANALSLWLTGN